MSSIAIVCSCCCCGGLETPEQLCDHVSTVHGCPAPIYEQTFEDESQLQKKESRRWTWESPNDITHAEVDRILTNRKWCLLEKSVGSSFCTASDHRLLRVKTRFICKLEKNSLHRPQGESLAVYEENILSEVLSKRDWQIKEDPTEDYEPLVERLKSCAEFASVPQARRSDCISITTKELLEKRRKLKLDPRRLTTVQAEENTGSSREKKQSKKMPSAWLSEVEDCRTEGGYVGSEEGPSDQEKEYYLLCRVRLSPRLKRRRLSESIRFSEADCSTVSCTAFIHVMERIDGSDMKRTSLRLKNAVDDNSTGNDVNAVLADLAVDIHAFKERQCAIVN
ncbi:unnamed protein product [Angiostrongylus costaricensis]|uniref:C2H2-type domain-containing protein n=1 Tax=Angiostrongylus costaricensis TaxID=334426 RepID=A0A158PKJ5_ANGCS|nr:unnamed protein product [Angiostrongylus costaricensis]